MSPAAQYHEDQLAQALERVDAVKANLLAALALGDVDAILPAQVQMLDDATRELRSVIGWRDNARRDPLGSRVAVQVWPPT